jgi:hypothetical protein
LIVVYVAGPYRAPTVWQIECNIHKAREVGIEVARVGLMPLVPHANTAHYDGIQSDAFWLKGTMELLRRADAVMLVPGWVKSEGTRLEIEEANRLGLPVFETIEALLAWAEAKQMVPDGRSISRDRIEEDSAAWSPPGAKPAPIDRNCRTCIQYIKPRKDCPECGGTGVSSTVDLSLSKVPKEVWCKPDRRSGTVLWNGGEWFGDEPCAGAKQAFTLVRFVRADVFDDAVMNEVAKRTARDDRVYVAKPTGTEGG